MRLLIYSGFNPRQKDNFGQTPLHLACINGDLNCVRELCEQVSNAYHNCNLCNNCLAFRLDCACMSDKFEHRLLVLMSFV